ncbi:MAG: MOSC domain-containing protein [Chloroflexota bacterium]
MSSPRLVSIQVGLPKAYGSDGADDPMDRSWQTGFFKQPVDGPLWLGKTNLVGDGQADLVNHGGEDKAVLCYAARHYPDWRNELARPDLPHGAFGENFTVDGLDEQTACLGDTYQLGDAVIQVSQPRQPCWKLAWRWRLKELTALVERSGRTGWYVRVLREGEVRPGLPVTLLDRPCPEWTVTKVAQAMRWRKNRPSVAGALAGNEYLAASWRDRLAEAAAGRV